MKKYIKTIFTYIDQVHTYPYWLFLFFLYSSIFTFGCCSILGWFPQLFISSHATTVTADILFECGMGLLVIGCITAPIMDLILHIDLDKK